MCAPHAFLGAIPVAVVLWMRALRFYDAKPLSALAACALGVAVFVAEVVMYREALETLRIFPVAQGEPARSTACSSLVLVMSEGCADAALSPRIRGAGVNVVARMAPLDGQPPAQRLIVTAHQDRRVLAILDVTAL